MCVFVRIFEYRLENQISCHAAKDGEKRFIVAENGLHFAGALHFYFLWLVQILV